jgi:pimeloyl-ACP methyl ester carboxylesterase
MTDSQSGCPVSVTLRDGHSLALSIFEKGEPSATLLCVHGWTLDHRSFAPQLPLSGQGFRLVLFDRRGFGDNHLAPGLHFEMDDLDAIIESLDGPIYGFGVSQGARLLLRYATLKPKAFSGLILQGGLVDGLPMQQEELPFERYAALLRSGDRPQFVAEWLDHPLMRSGVPIDKQDAVAELVSGYEGRDLLAGVCGPTQMDLSAVLPGLDIPMLVTEAAHESALRRRHGRFLVEECGADHLAMPGGHLCHFTHPQIFNDGVLNWFARLDHRADCTQ